MDKKVEMLNEINRIKKKNELIEPIVNDVSTDVGVASGNSGSYNSFILNMMKLLVNDDGDAKYKSELASILSVERVSKGEKPFSIERRNEIIRIITKAMLKGDVSQGNALKALRINILKSNQDGFGKIVGVSRKTISDIENNKGNCTLDVLNVVFRPFGLRVGLIPLSIDALKKVL